MPAKFDVLMDRRADSADVRLVGELDAAEVFPLEPMARPRSVSARG